MPDFMEVEALGDSFDTDFFKFFPCNTFGTRVIGRNEFVSPMNIRLIVNF